MPHPVCRAVTRHLSQARSAPSCLGCQIKVDLNYSDIRIPRVSTTSADQYPISEDAHGARVD